MSGYIIRKGEPINFLKFEDGRAATATAGVDLWVTTEADGTIHARPLKPMGAGETAIFVYRDKPNGNALVVPAKVRLSGQSLTYEPAPFSYTVHAGERVQISPDDLHDLVQQITKRRTPPTPS